MYIHRDGRADRLHERGGGDVVDADGAWQEAVHVATAPIARDGDDGESRVLSEELAEQLAQGAPPIGRDAEDGDVRVGVGDGGNDLGANADFGSDFDVGLSAECFADDVAEEGRHRPEDDAGGRHGCSVSDAAANATEALGRSASIVRME